MDGAVLKVVRPIEKHWESVMRQFSLRGKKRSITATAALQAADCNAPNWSVSHYVVPREKSAPAMRPFVKIL